MNRKQIGSLIGSSGVITMVVALPAGLFADAFAHALSSREPDWLYIACAVLTCLTLILVNLLVHLVRSGRAAGGSGSGPPTGGSAGGDGGADLVTRSPADRVSLGELVASAKRELWFHGVSAKRSVTEDSF